MSEPRHLFHIHRDLKYGGFDFGVSCETCDFSFDEMQQFRAMIVSAIGTMEDMFRRECERRNPAVSAAQPAPGKPEEK